ncbi:hypothetical protein GN956_G19649 [Arapaima gigas]
MNRAEAGGGNRAADTPFKGGIKAGGRRGGGAAGAGDVRFLASCILCGAYRYPVSALSAHPPPREHVGGTDT